MATKYKMKEYVPPQEPPQTEEELLYRFMLLERHVFRTAKRPSDLRQKVDLNSARIDELEKGGDGNGR
jgi:hypothetical protein